ncbi:MAG: hypothetical protein ABSG25_07310, partial [Bryobacteraceae bacterium]
KFYESGFSGPISKRLGKPPGGSDILGGQPARRFSLLGSFVSSGRAILRVKAHLTFGERQCTVLFAFAAPLKDSLEH